MAQAEKHRSPGSGLEVRDALKKWNPSPAKAVSPHVGGILFASVLDRVPAVVLGFAVAVAFFLVQSGRSDG